MRFILRSGSVVAVIAMALLASCGSGTPIQTPTPAAPKAAVRNRPPIGPARQTDRRRQSS